MPPSTTTLRVTSRDALAESLNAAAAARVDIHARYVLAAYALGEETPYQEIRNASHEWQWIPIPVLPGVTPKLVFLFGGAFTFEDRVQNGEELEVYDCPAAVEDCWQIALAGRTLVMVVYQ